jgi:hypothetical protein
VTAKGAGVLMEDSEVFSTCQLTGSRSRAPQIDISAFRWLFNSSILI